MWWLGHAATNQDETRARSESKLKAFGGNQNKYVNENNQMSHLQNSSYRSCNSSL